MGYHVGARSAPASELRAARGDQRPVRPVRGVRPCERDDLSQVVTLYESVVRSGTRSPPPRLAEYFERTFFDYPWADAEIPSLVYQDAGGRIVGFLGSHVRRLRLDGRAIRLACGGQLVVEPEARSKGVGAFLFRAYLSGPQDATITDGANNESVRRMWAVSGGETAHLKSIAWTRVLRPMRFGGDYLLGRLNRESLARRLRPVWSAMDWLALPMIGHRFRPTAPSASEEPLTPRALLEHDRLVTESLRCYPDYDEPFLDWLFQEMAEVKSRGTLVRSLVRNSGGQVIGWYVYYLQRGLSQVMQVAAKHGAAEEVLDQLLHHAYVNGSAAVRGRLEPQLLGPLSERRCILSCDSGALIHARAPAVLGVLLSNRAWLSRMDGEWWMGHHTESFS
jgi:GNAT superfamily N-acetyltransferase